MMQDQELTSQKLREIAPELDPLRLGTGWKPEDLSKPQIIIESTFGDSHPGSGHLLELAEEVRRGVRDAGGFGARYLPPTSATESPRATTASTTPWPPGT